MNIILLNPKILLHTFCTIQNKTPEHLRHFIPLLKSKTIVNHNMCMAVGKKLTGPGNSGLIYDRKEIWRRRATSQHSRRQAKTLIVPNTVSTKNISLKPNMSCHPGLIYWCMAKLFLL